MAYYYWSKESEGGSLLEQALKNWVMALRLQEGRKVLPSYLMVDAQSVKNEDTARQKGYNLGKKVSGIKRHILVDTQGMLHSAQVTTANVTDRQGELLALAQPKRSRALLADAGYTGKAFALAAGQTLGKPLRIDIAQRNELHRFKLTPKRWGVERFFAWLNKSRRLAKNLERYLSTSLQFLLLASPPICALKDHKQVLRTISNST